MRFHDVFMVFPRSFNGGGCTFMAISWTSVVLSRYFNGFPLCFHGAFMGRPWRFHGIVTWAAMVFPRNISRTPIVFSWRFYGALVVLLRCCHGVSGTFMGPPVASTMISWTPKELIYIYFHDASLLCISDFLWWFHGDVCASMRWFHRSYMDSHGTTMVS